MNTLVWQVVLELHLNPSLVYLHVVYVSIDSEQYTKVQKEISTISLCKKDYKQVKGKSSLKKNSVK